MRTSFVLVLVWTSLVATAAADTITVDTTDDELSSDSDCSLREAVQSANSDTAVSGCRAGSGADVIVIPPGHYELTLGSSTDDDTNAGGDLDVSGDVEIRGAGADVTTVRLGHAQGNVFEVTAAARVVIRGLTLTGMGGLANGGSSAVSSTSLMAQLVVEDCSIVRDPTRTDGSGIFAHAASTTVRRTLFDRPGIYGIWWTQGSLSVQSSTFASTTHGGIWTSANSTVSASIDHSTFVDNGRGALVEAPTSACVVTIGSCVFGGSQPTFFTTTWARFVSSGGNVVWDTNAVWGSGDLPSTDPQLGPLADNGGPTQTFLPGPASPARGFSDCLDTGGAPLTVDQRGVARPATACASGAVDARCGNGFIEGAEVCDGEGCCTATCAIASGTTVCRPAAGPCDAAESCTGVSVVCPSDGLRSSSTLCRPSAGDCDADDYCDGSHITCPSTVQPAGAVCRAAAGVCDVEEQCDGTSTACPADATATDGTACGDGAVCNGDELCAGGVCAGGTPLACDDGNLCTADACAEPGGCEATPVAGCCNVDADCDDGDACTADACSGPGGTCGASPISGCCASDADCAAATCTTASCNPSTMRCETSPVAGCCTSDADCDDGNACTTNACDVASGACGATPVPGCCLTDGDCDDSNTCTMDACDASTHACTNDLAAGCCLTDAECDDADACT
ncbi:MAG: CSLREA domain-containing protein, partial [Myxococcales bacterium]|nr:CSLREA domain-containing protein [Myxococcales bacterium]